MSERTVIDLLIECCAKVTKNAGKFAVVGKTISDTESELKRIIVDEFVERLRKRVDVILLANQPEIVFWEDVKRIAKEYLEGK